MLGLKQQFFNVMETQEEESLYRLLCSNDLAQIALGLQICSGTRPDILSELRKASEGVYTINEWVDGYLSPHSNVSDLEYLTYFFEYLNRVHNLDSFTLYDLIHRNDILRVPKPFSCRICLVETVNSGKIVFHGKEDSLKAYYLREYTGNVIDLNEINAETVRLKHCSFNEIVRLNTTPIDSLYLYKCCSKAFFDSDALLNVRRIFLANTDVCDWKSVFNLFEKSVEGGLLEQFVVEQGGKVAYNYRRVKHSGVEFFTN